jgi:pimeloyl-ACP methyl ester carboxylesterase
MASFVSDYLTMDVHEPLARLQMPVIILWGREGLTSPTAMNDAFKRVNPRIDVRILDKCRFELQDEQAASFNNLVKEFAVARAV